MDGKNLDALTKRDIVTGEVPWARHVAAGSLVAGAVLLVAGHKRAALSVAAAGAAITLLERPEAAEELWTRLPDYIRSGQDFLVKAEGIVEKLGEQAARLKESMGRMQG